MKTLSTLLVLIFFGLQVAAQVFSHAIAFPTLLRQHVLADEKGFIYSIGYDPKQNSPWSGGTGTMTLKIQKYDPASGDILWQRTVASPEFLNLGGAKLYKGRLFLGGAFRDSICSGTLCAVSKGNEDLFLIGISETGDVDIRSEGGIGGEMVHGFTMDDAGNCYFAGGCTGVVALGTRTYSAKGDKDPFILKKDKDFKQIYTIFGTPVNNSSGVAYALAIHRGNLYAWFTGWSVMEGSNDSIGSGFGQLYRVEPDLVSYTPIEPIYSHMYSSSDLQFVDTLGSLYYTSMFSYKTSGQSIVKADKNMKSVWSYTVVPGSVTNLLPKNGHYYYAASGQHPQTSENIYYIRQGTLNGPSSQPLCGIHLSYSGNYVYGQYLQSYGEDLLLSGQFSGNLQLGNTHLESSPERGSFAVVVRLGILNSLPEPAQHGVKIYPNPATELVTIATDNPEIFGGYLALSDVTGREVLRHKMSTEENGRASLDVSALQNGIYFLQLGRNGMNETHKLIINR